MRARNRLRRIIRRIGIWFLRHSQPGEYSEFDARYGMDGM